MMTGSVILILAGDWRPLEDMEYSRHLLPIGGKPLLLRTWEQIQRFNIPAFVLTPHKPIQEVVPHCFKVDHFNTGAETLLSARSIWGDRTFVLMGDTLYTDEVIDLIMADRGDLSFYGNYDEIFGVIFVASQADRVANALVETWMYKPWTWVFYRTLCGFGVRSHRFDDEDIYHRAPEDDITRDFDNIKTYKKFLREHAWARE